MHIFDIGMVIKSAFVDIHWYGGIIPFISHPLPNPKCNE